MNPGELATDAVPGMDQGGWFGPATVWPVGTPPWRASRVVVAFGVVTLTEDVQQTISVSMGGDPVERTVNRGPVSLPLARIDRIEWGATDVA